MAVTGEAAPRVHEGLNAVNYWMEELFTTVRMSCICYDRLAGLSDAGVPRPTLLHAVVGAALRPVQHQSSVKPSSRAASSSLAPMSLPPRLLVLPVLLAD
jgi:hypothetical protein